MIAAGLHDRAHEVDLVGGLPTVLCAVTGATCNPTIFAKAITGSDRYDDQLRQVAAGGERYGQVIDAYLSGGRNLTQCFDPVTPNPKQPPQQDQKGSLTRLSALIT